MAIPSLRLRRAPPPGPPPGSPGRKTWRTYSFRITLLYFALIGAAVLILFGAIYWVTADFMEQQLHSTIRSDESFLREAFDAGGIDALAGAITRRTGIPGQTSRYYLLQDPAGKRVAGNLPEQVATPGWSELPIPPQLDPGEVNSGEESDTLLARGVLLPNGWFLLVGEDTDRFTDFEDEIVDIAAWSLGGVFLLVVLGGRAVSASMLRRLNAISEASGEIMRGNFARRIELRGSGDEFDQLSTNLNAMLDRIQALMENLRQVSNDIAHDLRTPLTRLRQRLEEARDKAENTADFRAAVETAIGETDEILATFGALLRIAQIESGTRRAAFAAVDLSGVVNAILETYTSVAEDHRHALAGRVDAAVTIEGDRQLLVQMLANLVENAIRHTPPGTWIELELIAHAGRPVCRIRDDGPGIPEAERRKVFRRFYRLDASRTTPGNGLGLSLVAAIADLHRIEVTLEDTAPGLCVTLRFPGPGPF
jgi:signal transduction histidine kinase